ncbi:zn 2cys6 transcription factor [Ophiostoma piceae UAMH 11346]|uniref:Zn 2cys6 transcription factor n=1 Tax=Ophiostoma piceae (strain UAMH 11346) TaxID=1262450 RepID=S3BTS7_OPHP1|nr:zn 2cys6 transcription factor [Ophiostoma piceae UAMH 11346]
MATRQAACERCRKAKLACDHKVPCTRCIASRKGHLCSYRDSPFKRRRVTPPRESSQPSQTATPDFIPTRNAYPNPGYQGFSSHTTIFDHIPTDTVRRDVEENSTATPGSVSRIGTSGASPMSEPLLADSSLIQRGADLVKRCALTYDMDAMRTLVSFWLARGVNLAVGEDFVEIVTEAMRGFRPERNASTSDWCLAQSRLLFNNSIQPLDTGKATDPSEFSKQFTQDNMRWETLGLFFSALARSTIDVTFYPPLYRDVDSILQVRKFAAEISSLCMDLCLALDCMNDLQLVFQYENFIVHSCVDGDQSYRSWRKLGDVISSVYALGYHQKMEVDARSPQYIVELRRTVFCSLFSADKNVAIFLGRPPRMSQHFCVFQTPLHDNDGDEIHIWRPNTPVCYRSEMRWAALCAFRKELIVELLSQKKNGDLVQKASEIRRIQMEQWEALPAHFKFETSLKQASQSPFGRDHLVSARLNHLHVLFLLKLLELERLSDPDDDIIEVSQSMVAVVLEAILLRDQLANSGTGLVWKVVYFGIPAVGVTLLAILRKPRPWQARILQSLNVFVAEVEMGTIVKENEPNYALLSQVTQTIKAFLVSPSQYGQSGERTETEGALAAPSRWNQATDIGSPYMGSLNFDFEIGFWQDLEDYSSHLDGGLERPSLL